MLYFCNRNHEDKTWHVGSRIPVMHDIVEVQADGHELEWIQKNIVGVVTTTEPVQVWKHGATVSLYNKMRAKLGQTGLPERNTLHSNE